MKKQNQIALAVVVAGSLGLVGCGQASQPQTNETPAQEINTEAPTETTAVETTKDVEPQTTEQTNDMNPAQIVMGYNNSVVVSADTADTTLNMLEGGTPMTPDYKIDGEWSEITLRIFPENNGTSLMQLEYVHSNGQRILDNVYFVADDVVAVLHEFKDEAADENYVELFQAGKDTMRTVGKNARASLREEFANNWAEQAQMLKSLKKLVAAYAG